MITSISLAGQTPYDNQHASLDPLKELNFLYGPNGSGKTTLSRVLADEGKYPTCRITIAEGSQPQSFVYNRDFVEHNFGQSSELPGVFTIGSQDKTLLERLQATRESLAGLNSRLAANRGTLYGQGGLSRKIEKLNSDFATTCWSAKNKYPNFDQAFVGLNKSKEKFKAQLLEQARSNTEELESFDALDAQARKLYSASLTLAPRIEAPLLDVLIHADKQKILKKVIIGRADLDVSVLIQHLRNSDWVREGLRMIAVSDGRCPFCQQTFAAELETQLNAYFDQAFEKDRQTIDRLAREYSAEFERLQNWINEQIEQNARPDSFLQPADLIQVSMAIRARVSDNLNRIRSKQEALSTVVMLEPVSEELRSLSELLEAANKQIDEHNRIVNNQRKESDRLKQKIWKFFVANELRSEIATYLHLSKHLAHEEAVVRQAIEADVDTERLLESRLSQLLEQTSSSRPTVEKINATLRSVGFSRFKIEGHKDDAFYNLVRPDGTDAKQTLSEGEKTLVTFLYFFHWIQGNQHIAGDRVAVFDDPVSSLDSEILFVISTLMRNLCREVVEGRGMVRQVLLLTHNIYFFKEVTLFPRNISKNVKNKMTYWTIRKCSHGSALVQYTENPIKSSYEALWHELSRSPGATPSVTVQNCARRILEHFTGVQISRRPVGSELIAKDLWQ